MNPRHVSLAAVLLCVASLAQAQAYRWVDKDGKVRYTDTPPPAGTKSSQIKAPAPALPPKPAAKAPAANQTKEATEKAEREKQDLVISRENCDRSKEQVALLESGQRITRVNAKGERYFMDDAQRVEELSKAQASVGQWCK